MTEKQLMQAVTDAARLLGWLVYHTHDSRRSEPGFPDLVIARPGRIIFAELKSDTGRMSAAQDAWMDALAGIPGVVRAVWYPRAWLSGAVEACLRETSTGLA